MSKITHIFIDTNVYISHNFQFDGSSLSKIADLASNGDITVYITDITRREIQKHMDEAAKSAYSEWKKLRKSLMILRNMSNEITSVLFKPSSYENIRERLFANLDAFIRKVRVETIPIKDTSLPIVIDQYFEGSPPFGMAQDKKHEFPDAFVIEALKRWNKEFDQFIYVISEDNLLREACKPADGLISMQRIDEFLDMWNKHYDIAANLKNRLLKEEEIFEKSLEKAFDTAMLMLEEDWEADVEFVQIETFNLHWIRLLAIDPSDGHAEISCNASVQIQVDASYDDPIATYWDKEEERKYCFNTIEAHLSSDLDLEFVADIEFNPETLDIMSVNITELNKNQAVEISLEDSEVLERHDDWEKRERDDET